MHMKFCPICEKESYSASPESKWLCPYCGADLTSEPAQSPAGGKQDTANLGKTK